MSTIIKSKLAFFDNLMNITDKYQLITLLFETNIELIILMSDNNHNLG